MYESFYGFREKPFHVTADPAFLYPSRQHQEAMAHLLYGIRERLGFITIAGEVGTGKTTLAKALLQRLDGPVRSALVLHPVLSPTQLLRAILRDFSVEDPSAGAGTRSYSLPAHRGDLLATIERFLLRQADSGATAVLIVDEAQALTCAALEQIRLLSNVETPKSKLLQIVLLGQPELDRRLSVEPRLRALQQRVAVRYRIQPLAPEEVEAYIRHRLQVAGASDRCPRFTEAALQRIAQASAGIPRRINLLCDQALVAGFVRESREIDEWRVAEAIGVVNIHGDDAEPAVAKPIEISTELTQGGMKG